MCLLIPVKVYLFTTTLLISGLVSVSSIPRNAKETVQFRQMNGYYYTSLSTPNYPNEFPTPFLKFFTINTTTLQGFQEDPIVNIYLTELFINEDRIVIFDNVGNKPNITRDTKLIPITRNVSEIQLHIPNLYSNHHFRTKLHFHDIFGFNISIEVVDRSLGPVEWSCSIRNCSFAGRCKSFPGSHRLEFRCECLQGYSGSQCQYGPECDPDKNINFCLNGGTCRMYGYAGGVCECPPGFTGSKCQIQQKHINFVKENQDCSSANPRLGVSVNDRPCSLCTNFTINKDWHRYLVFKEMRISHAEYGSVLRRVFHGNFSAHPLTSIDNQNVEEVYGLVPNPKSSQIPPGMSIILSDSQPSTKLPYFSLQPRLSINKEGPLLEGEGFSLTCKSRVPANTSQSMVQFSWYKDHVLIQREYTTSHRHISQFEWVQENGNEIWSILMIDKISPFDMGVFTCQVTDLLRNVQECTDYFMQVVVPPQIEVMPMSLTMVKNESKILICSDSLEVLSSGSRENLEITWFKDQEVIKGSKLFAVESVFQQGQLLRIKNINQSGTFTCKVRNKGGERERSIRVEMIDSRINPHISCPETCEKVEATESRLVWNLTAIDQTAMIKCPQGFVGYAQRRCSLGPDAHGKWDNTDFSRCTHQELQRFNFTLQSMRNGYSVKAEGLSVLHNDLNKYLESRRSTKTQLLFGEGDKFISMLVDTFEYLAQLKQSSPTLVSEEHIVGLVTVVDNFIGCRNSCAHEIVIFDLVKHFVQFVNGLELEAFDGDRILISTIALVSYNTSSLFEIDSGSSRLLLDCNTTMDKVEQDRIITFIKLSEIMYLEDNQSLISDVVSVQISNTSCFKDDFYYEIQFQTNDTSRRNKTCAAMDRDKSLWVMDVCKINVSLFTVSCFCNRLGEFAVLALKEEQQFKPNVSELKHPPPNWIATSGCVACLVLCFRTLINVLLQRTFCPNFILTSIGFIVSILCLLSTILVSDSRGVGFLYLVVTLLIQALRIWRMTFIYDMNETYPWLEKVSKWTLLAAVIFTEILPLLTVFIFDCIFNDSESVLKQDSPVFITFLVLCFLSVLLIIVVHYKTVLRINQKISTNNNHHGDQSTLNENLGTTLIHLVQILCVILYLNERQYVIFHYFLAISSSVLGLAWRNSKKPVQLKRRNTPGDEVIPSIVAHGNNTNNTGTVPVSELRVLNKLELKPSRDFLVSRSRRYTSTAEDDEENDHTTIETNISVSTISNNGLGMRRPYYGRLPGRVECKLKLDDNAFCLVK